MNRRERHDCGPAVVIRLRRFWSAHVDALERYLERYRPQRSHAAQGSAEGNGSGRPMGRSPNAHSGEDQ